MNNNIPEPSTNQEPIMQLQNNLNLTQPIQNNTQMNTLNNGIVTDIDPMQVPKEEPKKLSKGIKIVMILLGLLIISLIGFIIYDRYTKSVQNSPKEESSQKEIIKAENKKYVSFDSKDYLKLNKDGTYELKINVEGKEIKSDGKYTKKDNIYVLKNNIKANVNGNYVEISSLEVENFNFYNVYLFNINNLEVLQKNINSSIVSHLNSVRRDYPMSPEIERVETDINECFRYSISSEDNDSDISKNMTCSISYKIYLKEYNLNECKESNSKYIGFLIPAGECKENYILSGKYFLLNEKSNFEVLSTFTGL